MNSFYVYQHKTKDTGEIFYIGKGKGYRAYSKVRNQYWKRIEAKRGFEVEIIKDNMTEKDALELEKSLTETLKPRANICIGGGGVTGYKHGPEQLRKLSENSKGKNNAFYGKKHSLETRMKIRKARLGQPSGFGTKAIICINDGSKFNSVTQAAKELNLATSFICRVLKGKLKHAKGYKFQYVGEGLS